MAGVFAKPHDFPNDVTPMTLYTQCGLTRIICEIENCTFISLFADDEQNLFGKRFLFCSSIKIKLQTCNGPPESPWPKKVNHINQNKLLT